MTADRWLVAMLGARMNFAVPRILHRAGRLERLLTDVAANTGWLRALRLVPAPLRRGGVQRLLHRVPEGVPAELTEAYTSLGLAYAVRFARSKTEFERVRLFLRTNAEFNRWAVGRDWGRADAAFVYNTAGLEIAREAKRRGLTVALEQTIAPYRFERELLADERRRYPEWEWESAAAAEFDRYADREVEEWALADRVLCGSDFVRERLVAAGVSGAKCRVVPYGVAAAFACPERPPHGGPLRVVTVGAAGLRKGTPYLVGAAKRLRGRAVFRWVGPLKMADAARGELGDDVEFTGPVPRSDVIRHYAWADVFALPSLCEGSATASYEALTAGLPVVCTPNTGSVVRDGVEGFVVPIRDAAALADRLARLADDPDLRHTMAAAARDRAGQFSYATYARSLLDALGVAGPEDRP